MRTLLVVLVALMFPSMANAQWADPVDLRNPGVESIVVTPEATSDSAQEAEATAVEEAPLVVPSVAVEALAVAAPAVVEITPPVRTPVCSPYDGCGLAPGQTIIPPPRPPNYICNPYKGCGITVPIGGVLVNPPRPDTPCGYAKPC